MAPSADELCPIGIVSGTHGLRGDLKVRPLSAGSDALLQATEVFLRCGTETVGYQPVKTALHKGSFLLRLDGLPSIEAVQPLVGCEVLMRYGDLPALTEDEHYWFELAGMRVTDRSRGNLGILEEMFTTAAHDIYVARGPRGEVLIPAVDEFVIRVDRQQKQLLVDLPAGLVPGDDTES